MLPRRGTWSIVCKLRGEGGCKGHTNLPRPLGPIHRASINQSEAEQKELGQYFMTQRVVEVTLQLKDDEGAQSEVPQEMRHVNSMDSQTLRSTVNYLAMLEVPVSDVNVDVEGGPTRKSEFLQSRLSP